MSPSRRLGGITNVIAAAAVGFFLWPLVLGPKWDIPVLIVWWIVLAFLITWWRRSRRKKLYYAPRTRHIPQDVKIAVSVRDQGRCRQCGSAENLHFDHIIPYSRGGANTVDNIQLLCATCNLRKGAR